MVNVKYLLPISSFFLYFLFAFRFLNKAEKKDIEREQEILKNFQFQSNSINKTTSENDKAGGIPSNLMDLISIQSCSTRFSPQQDPQLIQGKKKNTSNTQEFLNLKVFFFVFFRILN